MLAGAALAAMVGACSGVELRRPLIAYDFDNPILNERWLQAYQTPLPPARIPPEEAKIAAVKAATPEPATVTAAEGTPAPVEAARRDPVETPAPVVAGAAPPPAALVSPRGLPTKPLPVIIAEEQAASAPEAKVPPQVAAAAATERPEAESLEPTPPKATEAPQAAASPNPEIADAAGRLVGIRSSFDQDSFLKHVLFVSNVSLEDAPAKGLLRWIWKRYGTAGSRSLAPGHLVFLGWGGQVRLVGVVEAVDVHGTAQFVMVHGDEVSRLTVTPARPGARRDERTGRILNSAVGKGRLAGETLMGCVRVVPDAAGSAALVTAE